MKEFSTQIIATLLLLSVVLLGFTVFEPMAVSAVTDDVEVNLTVDSGISITSPADITMSNMGVSTDNSTGWTVFNVKTNDPDGYTLGFQADTDPALKHSSTASYDFKDYTEATPGTPDTWSVDASTWEFGFSALGTDVESEYGTGQTTCDNGSASSTVNTNLNFEGFTTSNEQVATRSSTTTTSGVDTRLCVAAGQNGVFAPAGSYSATITATATAL